MMREVETPIDPDAILGDGYIFLRVDRPIAWSRNTIFTCSPHLDEDIEGGDNKEDGWRCR